MFSRMKPLPKALIIAAIVGAAIYGASFIKFPEKKPEAQAVTPTVVTPAPEKAPENPAVARAAQKLEQAEAPSQPAQAQPAPSSGGIQFGVDSSADRGMDALLKKGGK